MAAALGWGALAAAALLVGALISYHLSPGTGVIAQVMALGAGLLIGSVAFELVDEALRTRTVAGVGLFVLVGAATFTVGDWLISRRGGRPAQGPRWGAGPGIGPGDRAGVGAGRHPRVVRAGPHRAAVRGERVAARRGGALEPARGHVLLERAACGALARAPRAAHVVGRDRGLRAVRGPGLRGARPGPRDHRRAGAGIRGRGAAGHAGDDHAPRGVRARGPAHRSARRAGIRGLPHALRGLRPRSGSACRRARPQPGRALRECVAGPVSRRTRGS